MTSPVRMTSRILFLPFLWCSFLYAPLVFAGEIARHEAAPSRQVISVVTSAEADSPHVVPVPSSSVINFSAGQTRANDAIVALMGSPIGSMTIQTDITGGGTTHFLFDVNGYFKFVSN